MNKGIYIHIPFCKKKCPYCDFYSVTDTSLIDGYVDSLIRNITDTVNNDKFTADTVYFGGGTPSLLSAKQIERIISSIPIYKNAEISIECNPNSVNSEYLSDIKKAGINRISFGIQSLNDNELLRLGRLHNKSEAISAVYNAYNSGFENISADLMIAIPEQTMNSLEYNLDMLTSLPIKHISAYMLKIEKGTSFFNNPNIAKEIPDEDSTADMYLYTIEKLKSKGFLQYEISNFSQNGYESRHNLKYWNCEEYYGFGTSAHSYINGKRYSCNSKVHEFLTSPLQDISYTDDNAGGFEETAMLKLRLTKTGFDTSEYHDKMDDILKRSAVFEKNGLVNINNNVLTLTPKGCLVSNYLISRIIYP